MLWIQPKRGVKSMDKSLGGKKDIASVLDEMQWIQDGLKAFEAYIPMTILLERGSAELEVAARRFERKALKVFRTVNKNPKVDGTRSRWFGTPPPHLYLEMPCKRV